jgi:hypothetical protein
METLNDTKIGVDNKVGQLKAILYLLQTNLEDMKGNVDQSYELLKIGVETELSKKIENTIDDPFNALLGISNDFDIQIKAFIDKKVKNFLKSSSEIIECAYRTKTSLDDLHYSIVLKNDDIANRDRIFEFLDKYDLWDYSQKYPVYFQFVPSNLINKIYTKEKLSLEV